jgi:hypothetical protein
MYTVSAVEIHTGAPMGFGFRCSCDERATAKEIVGSDLFHAGKTVFIFDQGFFSRDFAKFLLDKQHFFIMRIKYKGNDHIIKKFLESGEVEACLDIEGMRIRFLKISNDEYSEPLILCTNLPKDLFSLKELTALYQRRWTSETSNRTATKDCHVDRFHGRDLNKILQEIYTHRLLSFLGGVLNGRVVEEHTMEILTDEAYHKASMSQIIAKLATRLFSILYGFAPFFFELSKIALRSIEQRLHNSRHNPRVTKYRPQPRFPSATVPIGRNRVGSGATS